MKTNDFDKRIKARETAQLYVGIYLEKDQRFFGLLADLSDGGFKMSSEQSIKTNKEYTLLIKNPFIINEATFFNFSAQAVWSTKHEYEIYETGFEFTYRSIEVISLLETLETSFKSLNDSMSNLNLEKYLSEDDPS